MELRKIFDGRREWLEPVYPVVMSGGTRLSNFYAEPEHITYELKNTTITVNPKHRNMNIIDCCMEFARDNANNIFKGAINIKSVNGESALVEAYVRKKEIENDNKEKETKKD